MHKECTKRQRRVDTVRIERIAREKAGKALFRLTTRRFIEIIARCTRRLLGDPRLKVIAAFSHRVDDRRMIAEDSFSSDPARCPSLRDLRTMPMHRVRLPGRRDSALDRRADLCQRHRCSIHPSAERSRARASRERKHLRRVSSSHVKAQTFDYRITDRFLRTNGMLIRRLGKVRGGGTRRTGRGGGWKSVGTARILR